MMNLRSSGIKRLLSQACFLLLIFFFSVSNVQAKSYQRIVSLAPSITEILFSIGAGDRVVGVTTYCDYPDAAKLKPKVGGFTEHNLEAIVLQKPDLVILTPNRGSKFTYEKLKQIGLETLVVPFYGLKDLSESFCLIGEKTGNLDQAQKVKSEFMKTVEEVRSRGVNRRKRKVAFVSWRSPLIVPARGTLESDIIELAGGENMIGESTQHYPEISIEAFFTYDPDLIIEASGHHSEMSFKERKELVRKFWRQYPSLRAVKSGEVYVLKHDVYSVPSFRTIRFIRAMDALLDPSTKAENEFYERIQF